jgi:AmiR/NasT family two-component response regulator
LHSPAFIDDDSSFTTTDPESGNVLFSISTCRKQVDSNFLGSSQGAILRLPVLLLTGCGDRAIRDRACELGVGAYLEKPVNNDTLIGTITELAAAAS